MQKCFINLRTKSGGSSDVILMLKEEERVEMYPMAPQFVFEGSNARFCAKMGDNEANKNVKRSQFEMENILKSNFCDSSVTAESEIEKNSSSHQFMFNQVAFEDNFPKKFSVVVQSDGLIAPQEAQLKHKFWFKRVRVADDIPGANVLLDMIEDKIELKTIKQINVNDELLLWYSEEILSFMGIPFLTPANIQGQKAYVCLQCYRSYEVPNQLKIHLARSCDKFDENTLWKRLQSELLSRHQRKMIMHSKNFELLNPYHSAIMQGLPTSSRRFSAFQPVINKCESSSSPPAELMPMPNLSPSSQSSLNDSALAAAAHLETIVSNMGTSKQGHLCIYCGKLYSRKYGLKIHIRTHTGFKPLKCRHCFRAFGDPSNLNKHIRLHNQHNELHHPSGNGNGASTYKCHICSKLLLKRRDLQRHMQLKHSSNLITNSSMSSVDDSSITLMSPTSSSSSEDETEIIAKDN